MIHIRKRPITIMVMMALSLTLAAGNVVPWQYGFVASAESSSKTIELTLEGLKAYNGTKGKPSYVAFKGIIYDVSKVEAFKKNIYKTLIPGTDITKALAKIKNGEALLKSAVKIGKVVAKTTTPVVAKPNTGSTGTTSGSNTSTEKSDSKASTGSTTDTAKPLELTLEQLKAYDGKDGHKAYVAIDGIIYDVTAIPAWKNGIHQGKYQAGQDLSEVIKKSPHGKAALDKAIVVGKIKTQ